MTVHGDDFTCSAGEADLAWAKRTMEGKFEITSEVFGPWPQHAKQIRVLNRVISWAAGGLVYEPDHRHAEIVIRELGFEGAKVANSLGGRE